MSGEVDERSVARLDVTIEAWPLPGTYAPSDLDLHREQGRRDKWIRDVGSDVRQDSMKTELQAHEQNEQKVQAVDGL